MDKHSKRFNIKHFLIIIVILLVVIIVIISVREFSFKKEYTAPTALSDDLPRYRVIDLDNVGCVSDADSDGINDQKDILLGAKKQLEAKAKNIFIEGSSEPNYYKGGDPPQDWALCTDIIARAFIEAGLDLRGLVYEDIKNNFNEYPLREIWNQRVCDPDIDYRRIQNLEIFFKRNGKVLLTNFDISKYENLSCWLPGDVVFFDMDGDGYSDNAGIISDNTTRSGVPKVIYNYIDPGYTCERDILGKETITGHYRYPK